MGLTTQDSTEVSAQPEVESRVIVQAPYAADELATHLNADQTTEMEPDQPASKLVDGLLAFAIRTGATDIHIEPFDNRVDVRLRIDGVMRPIRTAINPENARHIVNRLKVMSKLDIAEKRRPQDGSFAALYSEPQQTRQITFRLSVIPAMWDEVIAIRILDPLHFEMKLDQLGMPADMLALYRKLAAFPHGILLVTGPTGSGKTTSLYCTIREMEHRNDIKIMTIEDPVEYHFDNVSQTHVSEQMSFATALRAFLRQNADVLLVGEIRDAETAEVSIRAATTGHLILSTVHTKDAISALARLRFLQVSDDYLSSTLIGVVAQRLVRRICRECKIAHQPSAELISTYYKKDAPKFYRGKGCSVCDGTGYNGEIGIFELFVPDDELVAMIAQGDTVDLIRRRACEKGFRTFTEDALEKVRLGITTLEEVARRIPPKYLIRENRKKRK